MTPHQTLAVAIRLFAILVALYVARELLGFYIGTGDRDDAYALPIVAVASVLAVVFVVALWLFPKSIARGLLPSSSDMPAKPSAPDIWLAVGAALIGLWLVASAIPALTRNLLVLYIFRFESVDKSGLMSGLLYYAVQLIVGVALIFGANGVRNFISWARTAGSAGPSNSVVESDARQEARAPHHER